MHNVESGNTISARISQQKGMVGSRMGYSISWCAVREERAGQFIQKLGLEPTGETEEVPDSLIASGKLDTGWRVIWYNDYGCPFLRSQDLANLSIEQDVLLCLVEEHVMASSSELWSGGKCKWRVSHEGENGPKGLSMEGDLPDPFSAVRKEMEELQIAAGGDAADVDHIFEIPLKVAQSLVGFKHDEDCTHLIGGHFEVLSRDTPQTGILARLFWR
jgi:hypothetical protein